MRDIWGWCPLRTNSVVGDATIKVICPPSLITTQSVATSRVSHQQCLAITTLQHRSRLEAYISNTEI